jgi:hypothetical protein
VLGATLMRLFMRLDRLTSSSWRIVSIACAAMAMGGLAIQQSLRWMEARKAQKQAEEDRHYRRIRDRRLNELMALAGTAESTPAAPPSDALRNRVLQLGHDIVSLLPQDEPQLNNSLNRTENIDEIWFPAPKSWGAYATAIHYAYLQRFKDRAVNLFNELPDHGIRFDLEPWEIDPPQAVPEKYIQHVAEECFLIAARMEVLNAPKCSGQEAPSLLSV